MIMRAKYILDVIICLYIGVLFLTLGIVFLFIGYSIKNYYHTVALLLCFSIGILFSFIGVFIISHKKK